ncbi:MAG: hypothetical protein IRZ28_02740 [Steroidobacteraceae bacterium]|nr:hypothetical protein [Steroidobacteraceae bacterium]
MIRTPVALTRETLLGRSAWLAKMVALMLLAAAVLVTAGCNPFRRSSDAALCPQDEALANARSVPPLKIPPGLESPDTSNALRIPELNTPAPPPRTVAQGCLDEPPPFAVKKPTPPEA